MLRVLVEDLARLEAGMNANRSVLSSTFRNSSERLNDSKKLSDASATKVKTKVDIKKSGVDIDSFIKDTKKFIEKKTKLVTQQENNDLTESIIVTDDDIERFVEVVTVVAQLQSIIFNKTG